MFNVGSAAAPDMGWKPSFLLKMQYFLITTLPLGILGFAFAVIFGIAGIALTPIGIGIPILYVALVGSRRLMSLDEQVLKGGPDRPGGTRIDMEEAAAKPAMRQVLLSAESYLPLLYWLLKLPLSILQFTLAVAFPVSGFVLLFAPFIHWAALHGYGYELFNNDVVMDMLLPMATPAQRSYVVAGLGLIWFLIGFYAVNRMFRASVLFVSVFRR